MRPHNPGAIPTLFMGGGSQVDAAFGQLLCAPFSLQVNVWDTEAGQRPVFRVFGTSGQVLCGSIGQAPCPQNPTQRHWTSETIQTAAPIGRATLESEETHISTLVLE